MFEGKTLPIDFKMACYLRDQARDSLGEMTKGELCTNGARAQLKIWQDMASLLCPGHAWKDVHDTYDGQQILVKRVCEVCGGEDDGAGEPLDYWLKEMYSRGCHNCGEYGVEDGDSVPCGEGSVKLPGGGGCHAEEFADPDEEKERLSNAIMKDGANCPYWVGRQD